MNAVVPFDEGYEVVCVDAAPAPMWADWGINIKEGDVYRVEKLVIFPNRPDIFVKLAGVPHCVFAGRFVSLHKSCRLGTTSLAPSP